MWLGLTLLVLGAFALIGALFAGGIFTIILIAAAVVAVATAAGSGLVARAAGVDRPEDFDHDPRPGHVEATADDLVNARTQTHRQER